MREERVKESRAFRSFPHRRSVRRGFGLRGHASRLLTCCAMMLLLIPLRHAEGATYYGFIRRGNRYFKNELFREALGYYVRGGEKNPRALEPSFNAGGTLYKLEDYVRSIEQLTHALQSAKKTEVQSDILHNLGNNYYRLGDYQKAVDHYVKGLELKPYDLDLKYNLELALKKLDAMRRDKEEQKGHGGKDESGGGDDRGEGEKSPSPSQKPVEKPTAPSAADKQHPPASSGVPEKQEENSLSREEAERVIRSVNTDQSMTIGDTIKRKLGSVQNEKDW